jgi:hypothetical protein
MGGMRVWVMRVVHVVTSMSGERSSVSGACWVDGRPFSLGAQLTTSGSTVIYSYTAAGASVETSVDSQLAFVATLA